MLNYISSGGLAQLVRASASHAEGQRFESATLHFLKTLETYVFRGFFFFCIFKSLFLYGQRNPNKKEPPPFGSGSFDLQINQSLTYGSRATMRALLMASVSSR